MLLVISRKQNILGITWLPSPVLVSQLIDDKSGHGIDQQRTKDRVSPAGTGKKQAILVSGQTSAYVTKSVNYGAALDSGTVRFVA